MDSLTLPPSTTRRWVVLKFGGTSVSTKDTWATIAARAIHLLPTHDVWITVSAISQTTNRLIECLRESIERLPPTSFEWVCERHAQLAKDLGVEMPEAVAKMLDNLKQILDGVRLTGEVSPRLRARVLGMGELMSSTLGQVALSQMVPDELLRGKPVAWVDARRVLRARPRPSEQDEDHFLEADVMPCRNELLARQESHSSHLVITQGFIAASAKADSPMVLLGRGGSDTSGALFAAVLDAERYEYIYFFLT
jgi:diaminopimelate decarboxylase/aspartate kinase